MRRRDSFGNDNRGFDDYTSLTQYDEMSTQQMGAGIFGSSVSAQPQQSAQSMQSTQPQGVQGGLYTQLQQMPQPSQNIYTQPQQQNVPIYGQADFLSSIGVQSVAPMQNSGFDRSSQNNGGFVGQNNAQNFFGAQNVGMPVEERPMVFSIERDPNGYIYEYSDRLEYYRYTGAGMVLINSVKKNR